ncbi:putative ATPase [Oscillibacter valericigenes Sjm18-20]|nr:putative ATPase [Oscillibacter valericigenes Sjm18-20]
MEKDELREVACERLLQGYETQWELMSDLFAWLDLRLFFYYQNHRWLGPGNEMKNMLGLVVSREEFEHNLAKAAQQGLVSCLSYEDAAQLEEADEAIRFRLERTKAEFPLLALFDRCGLDAFERQCVVAAYAVVLDRKYEKLFAYLQDDITEKAPTCSLAVQLFLPADRTMEEFLSRFSRRDRFTELFEAERLSSGALILNRTVLEFLSTGTVSASPGLRLFDGEREAPSGPLVVGAGLAGRLDAVFAQDGPCAVCLHGGPGMGKRFQVEHLMARRGERCVFADLRTERPEERAAQAALAARLCGAYLCCFHLDGRDGEGKEIPPQSPLLEAILGMNLCRDKTFLLSQLPIRGRMERLTVDLELPPSTEEERIALFRAYLADGALEPGLTVEELASKFRFSPGQIRLACEQALGLTHIDGDTVISTRRMHKSCYRQVVHKLENLATQVRPAFSWDDVVMPEDQKKLLRHACSHIKYRHQVYYGWGFDKKIAYGRGLSVLFAGAPGTGKTMCAQVIANELNMEMYKINISQIVSKYIGETEKNLQAVFTEAKHSNCVLFFDECDALFGKRGEVKDSNDRSANVEVAYLLQQIEEYDGVCILATNLIGNIDDAFMRRITYVVHFPFPDAAMRAEIYRRTIPQSAPLADDIDWKFLAEKFELSGGHIKNIVLSAAFLAAQEGVPIGMSQLLRAAVGELKKNEIVVVREELREFADLLDG